MPSSGEPEVQAVYAAHYDRLAAWAGALIGDRHLGHDVATEAFVRLLRHWDHVDDPRPWLYTTAGNLVRDHWRTRSRETRAYERMQRGGADRDGVSVGADATDALTIRDAVEALPDRTRLPVLLYYFADLSVAQVAAQLGKSQGAVKRDLSDARALLARHLQTGAE